MLCNFINIINFGKKVVNSAFWFVKWSSELLVLVLSMCQLFFVIFLLVGPLLGFWRGPVVCWILIYLIKPFPVCCFGDDFESFRRYLILLSFCSLSIFSIKDSPNKYTEESSADSANFTNCNGRVGLITPVLI